MAVIKKIKNYFKNAQHLDTIKAEYYAKGQEDASSRFISQQKKMTTKIEELSAQNIAAEHRLRTAADQRVERMEHLNNEKCTSCRQNMEAERLRLIKRQSQLAKKMSEFEEVWVNMYQHAVTIIDEHDILLRSSGRLVSSRNVLLSFKKDIDKIRETSAPLLSVEMQNGLEDIVVDTVPDDIPDAVPDSALKDKPTHMKTNNKKSK